MLAFDTRVGQDLDFGAVTVERSAADVPAAKADLNLQLTEHIDAGGAPKGVSGIREYPTDTVRADTAELPADRLSRLLDAAARTPGLPTGGLCLLTPDEREQVPGTWNDTARQLPVTTLPAAFRVQDPAEIEGRVLDEVRRRFPPLADADDHGIRAALRTGMDNLRPQHGFVPELLRGDMTLVAARSGNSSAWQRFVAGQLTVRRLEVGHHDVFGSAAEETGRLLAGVLPGSPPATVLTRLEESAVTNPFDDDDAQYHVLVNDEGQYSLWPAGLAVPAGWTAVLRDERRAVCLDHIEAAWQDMRPRSLVAATEPQDGPGAEE